MAREAEVNIMASRRPPAMIIGIAGTNGSGKDSLGQILADDYGWQFISVTDILRDGLREKKLPIERENLRELSAQWRRESGLGVLVNKAVEIYQKNPGGHKGLVIASLRNPGEADRVHELGGKVVWVMPILKSATNGLSAACVVTRTVKLISSSWLKNRPKWSTAAMKRLLILAALGLTPTFFWRTMELLKNLKLLSIEHCYKFDNLFILVYNVIYE